MSSRNATIAMIVVLCISLIACLIGCSGRRLNRAIQELKDKNPQVRCSAAESLGKAKDARAVGPLIIYLTDDDPAVRNAVQEALVETGTPAISPLIDACLNGNHLAVERRAAREALLRIGSPVIDLLADALVTRGDGAYWEAQAIREVLARMDPPGVARGVARVTAHLDDRKPENRSRAARILGDYQDESAVPALLTALKDSDYRVRRAAARALGKIGDTRAVQPLIHALDAKDSDVRDAAAAALGRIGDIRATGPLLAGLRADGDQKSFCSALKQIGRPALPQLTAALSDRDRRFAFRAAGVLLDVGGGEARRRILASSSLIAEAATSYHQFFYDIPDPILIRALEVHGTPKMVTELANLARYGSITGGLAPHYGDLIQDVRSELTSGDTAGNLVLNAARKWAGRHGKRLVECRWLYESLTGRAAQGTYRWRPGVDPNPTFEARTSIFLE